MSGQGKGLLGGHWPLPMIASSAVTDPTAFGSLRKVLSDLAGRLIVAGTRQGLAYTPEPIPSVPFFPQNGQGQVIAIGAVAVTSAAMTLNREHCFWSEQNCWIRVGAGAAALDFPFPAGAVFTYTPRTLGADDTISVIQMAALGGNFYIGQSEQT